MFSLPLLPLKHATPSAHQHNPSLKLKPVLLHECLAKHLVSQLSQARRSFALLQAGKLSSRCLRSFWGRILCLLFSAAFPPVRPASPSTQWSICILYRTKNADKDCHKSIFHKPFPGLSTETCKITNPHHIHRTEGLVSRSPALQLHSTPTSQL